SRARGLALSRADLVTVVGMPLDSRVGFDHCADARVMHVADHPGLLAGHVELAAGVAGDLAAALTALAEAVGEATEQRRAWSEQLRDAEAAARAADAALLESDAAPIHPARVCGELRRLLDRDAVVIGDGDDLMSFVGCYVDTYTPGCWLDPGPFGCLGTGMGYAAAARLAHPHRQVVAVLGEGAAARGMMDAATLVRHRLPVLVVVGNNGIWPDREPGRQRDDDGDGAADRQPGLRYDEVVTALGGAGETVQRPSDLAPAFERGLAAGVPYLVNVLIDPTVSYTDPRPPTAAARPPST
ncbi:MAG: thiamine pyrophosphate-dependent enzyme, partial [Actinomycetota bacterium]|nr:thiamine pyrophosphate-dependent enzyme [Actinomycetota bacterium]